MKTVSDTFPPQEGLPAYAWPGGFPLFYLDDFENVLCPLCANEAETRPEVKAYDINWDVELYCRYCGGFIESAYGGK